MPGRRPFVALLLLAALSALALPTALPAVGAEVRAPSSGPDVALGGLRWSGLDPAVIRLNSERDGEPGPERIPRGGLVLLVVVALLAGRAELGRGPATGASLAASRPAWWWPLIGRAPPVVALPVR